MSGDGTPHPKPTGYRFEPLELLGHGSSGHVWRCRDPRLGLIAVKLLNDDIDPAARERLRREHHVLASIRHPNVVRVLELFEEPAPALAMELVDGRPLLDALDDGRVLDLDDRARSWRLERLIAFLQQLLDALGAVHRVNLLHRDVKPANAVVSPSGTLKLLDLGLAAAAATDITGTLRYMAPEVLGRRGGHEAKLGEPVIDARADLYGVGAIAYEALAGDVPFADEAEDLSGFLTARVNREARPLRELNPAVPQPLADAVSRLVARRPGDRPATAAHAARLLSEALAGRGDLPTPEDDTVRLTEPPLIGRDDELALLAGLAATALGDGASGGCLISGEAGIGKSGLVDGALAGLDPGVLVLRVRGRSEARPLAAFREALDEIVFAVGSLDPATVVAITPPQVGVLQELTPRVTELPGFDLLPPVFPAIDDLQETTRRTDTVRSLLAGVAELRPVVVIADAIDEMTDASRRVVSLLAAAASARRLLVVATARTGDLEGIDWPTAARTIPLAQLSDADLTTLVTASVGGPPDPQLDRWIAAEAGGNPGRALELLRAAARADGLHRRGATVALDPQRGAELVGDGGSDRALLDGIAAAELEVLGALAVLARPSRLDELSPLTRASTAATARAVQGLLGNRLVLEEPGGVSLASERVRRATVAALGVERLRNLHRRAARTAEKANRPAEQIARHWLQAGSPGRALRHLPAAVDAMLQSGALTTAEGWASAGCDHLAGLARPPREIEATLRTLRAQCAMRLGHLERADRDLERVDQLLSRTRRHSPELSRRLLETLWSRHRKSARHELLKPRFEGYLEQALRTGDELAAAFAHERLSQIWNVLLQDADRGETHAEAATAIYLRLGERAHLAQALNANAVIHLSRGDARLAEPLLRRALDLSRELGLLDQQLLTLQNLGLATMVLGHHLDALHAYREAEALSNRLGERVRAPNIALNIGAALTTLGQHAEAITAFDRAHALALENDQRALLPGIALNRGMALLRVGDARAAIGSLDEALVDLDAAMAMYRCKALFVRAEAHLQLGAAGAASTDIAAGRAAGDDHRIDWTEAEADFLCSWLALRDGRNEDTVELARRVIPDARMRGDRMLDARAHALLARALGSPDGVETAQAAVQLAVDSGDPMVEIESRAALVAVLPPAAAAGERTHGAELAERIAAKCGDDRACFLGRTDVRSLLDPPPHSSH